VDGASGIRAGTVAVRVTHRTEILADSALYAWAVVTLLVLRQLAGEAEDRAAVAEERGPRDTRPAGASY